ncbi:chemotaxis protein CheA [Lampropedia puyangensis]|uniref:Chemotaxis protein CheA n=1 Tax=Lampropedia puyangensis TaxID=1330072 RepID=A0A4S8EVR4_9BURK|nr:chemotaxis protein CheA [Lampropedia puyangensis]THT98989.1 chemotaxis protein CheA [Lampropedia puyangensis]
MPDRFNAPDFTPPQIDLRQFYRLFFEETQDNLDQLERMLLATNWGHAADEDFHALFRCAHSIKGSAATFGFDAIAQLSHHMESLLDLWRKRLIAPEPTAINHMLAAADLIRTMVANHAQDRPLETPLLTQVEHAVAALQLHDGQASTPQPQVSNAQTPALTPTPIQELAAGPTETTPYPTPSPIEDDDFGFFAGAPGAPKPIATTPRATASSAASTNAQTITFGNGDPASAAPPISDLHADAPPSLRTAAGTSNAESGLHSVRVPMERVDAMVNLLGDLIVSQTALQQMVLQLEKNQRDALQLQLDIQQELIRNMRETVMHIRMVPVSQLFKRFPRLVHDLSERLHKQVRLITEGDATELDKAIIEHITDPLMHLLRNCMDHGIETPQERLRIGKPAEGSLWIRAQTDGNQIVIQVQDDGRGLSRDKLLASAAQHGMVVADHAPDSHIWHLAFLPGVSTSEAISDLSGRGVGMDVVKRNIENLGGRVDIDSIPQQGTTITLRLPLTLAITDGLVVQVASEQYILPLAAVQESMPAKPLRIETIGHSASVLHINQTYYPVVALDQLFAVTRQSPPAPERNATLLLLQAGTHQVGLLVDALIGQQQVVVKSVETHYRKIPYVAAATVLGDGQVALILDVAQLATIRHPHGWIRPENMRTTDQAPNHTATPQPSTLRPTTAAGV